MVRISLQRVLRSSLVLLLVLTFLMSGMGSQTVIAATPGKVVAWGANWYGQTNVPTGLRKVIAISAGWEHSLALKSDGTVVAWGSNTSEQTNVPAGLGSVVAISAGRGHNLALKSDGTVVAWGENWDGRCSVPAGLNDVIAIAAGGSHSLALKSDGTVVAWGSNYYGQADVPVGLNNVTAIAAGGYHSLALKDDGTVVVWGDQSDAPPGLKKVIAIAAGDEHSVALKSNGTVVAWGYSDWWQTAVPTGLNDVTAISAGRLHSLALKSDGTAVGWGWNKFGQFPYGLSGVTAIAAGGYHSMVLIEPSDTTAPTITITSPANDATYLLGQTVLADYSCQEEEGGSGLASCIGSVENGSPIDTSSVGAKTFTVDAEDNDGNSASLTHNYNVVFNFNGFFKPVDNPPAVNIVKAGSSIPIKFSLGGNQGLGIFADGVPVSIRVSCTDLTPIAAEERTLTSGRSGLKYDAAADTYTYVWKTNRMWGKTCRELVLRFIDGSEYRAVFRFLK